MRKILVLAALLAGCEKSGSPREVLFRPLPPEFIHGLTPQEDAYGSLLLDTNGEPRVVWRRSGVGIDEIVFVSRAGGGWQSVIAVSDDVLSGNVKTEPVAVLSNSNNRVHVFWQETAGAAPGIHYAELDYDGSIVTADSVVSTAVPANAPGGTVGAVTPGTLTALLDPDTADVFVAWAQLVTAAGSPAADEVVIVAAALGGFGPPAEPFAMVTPDLGATPADVVAAANPPVVLVMAGGLLQVLWVGTTAGGSASAVRHQERTGPAAYAPGGNGDVVSDTTDESYRFLHAVAGPSGLVAAWAQSTLPVSRVEAAYRPAGGPFDPSLVIDATPGAAPIDLVALDLAVDPFLEISHFFYKRASGGLLEVAHQNYDSGLLLPIDPEETVGPTAFSGASPGTIVGIVNDNLEALMVWDEPRFAGGPDFDAFSAVRPLTGSLTLFGNLTDSPDDSRLSGWFKFAFGSIGIAVIEGPPTGSREVLGSRYDTASGFAPLQNLSQSPITDSHGDTDPGRVAMAGFFDLTLHYLYREHTGGATHDLAWKRE